LVVLVAGVCAGADGWLAAAAGFLAGHPDVASVCGRRRERFPERSIFNQLCDIEWDAPAGQTKACGGDVMTRMVALEAVGGYRDASIAGEEPELCVRLRAAGWKVWRLAAEMTAHDAAMTRLSQWWKRSVRTGYTYAEGAALHGSAPERHKVRESRRAWLWGLCVPVGLLAGAALLGPWLLWGFLIYPFQMLRLYLGAAYPARIRAWWAFFTVAGKFAEAAGQCRYLALHWSGRRAHLIEYK
jgi:GT2 family glycosyltransferase